MLRTKLRNLFLLIEQQGTTVHISSKSDESELGVMMGNPAERIFAAWIAVGQSGVGETISEAMVVV